MTQNSNTKKKFTFLGFTALITIGVFYLGVWQTSRHLKKKPLLKIIKTK